MTPDKVRERIAMHVGPGSVCNRNATRLVFGGVMRDHGQAAVDPLIRDYGLEQKWGIKPGTHFEGVFK